MSFAIEGAKTPPSRAEPAQMGERAPMHDISIIEFIGHVIHPIRSGGGLGRNKERGA